MIKVAGYCRVSTDQDDQANSFATQKTYFRQYIENNPCWQLHEIYADEGITGTTTRKRTEFNRMIKDAYEGKFRLILTKEVSRFSRNILDTIAYTRELRSIGIGVIFLTDRINTMEPEAEMLLSYLASMAQEESRRTSTRVVWGQTRQMEKGVVFGRSLLGYHIKDGVLTMEPDGAEIVRLIFHKYALEQVGTSQIAQYLTDNGYLTDRGNAHWSSSTVTKILRNEKYAGDLIQKKTYTPDFLTHAKRRNQGQVPLVTITNHHEPLVRREVWDMAQQRLHRNNKHSSGNDGHSNRYIFSGKIQCGQCGSMFVGRFRYRKDGTKIRRWSCSTTTKEGTKGCDVGKLIRDDDAMQMLKTAIRSLPMDAQSMIHTMTQLALETILEANTDPAEDSRRLQSEIAYVQRKKEAVLDSYFSMEISKADMQAMNQNYDRQIQKLRQKMAELSPMESKDEKTLRNSIHDQVAGLLSGQIESEVFYKTILEGMTVYKDRQIQLRLHELPHVFVFVEETQFDTDPCV